MAPLTETFKLLVMISYSLICYKPLMCAMQSVLFIGDDYDRSPYLYKEKKCPFKYFFEISHLKMQYPGFQRAITETNHEVLSFKFYQIIFTKSSIS